MELRNMLAILDRTGRKSVYLIGEGETGKQEQIEAGGYKHERRGRRPGDIFLDVCTRSKKIFMGKTSIAETDADRRDVHESKRRVHRITNLPAT